MLDNADVIQPFEPASMDLILSLGGPLEALVFGLSGSKRPNSNKLTANVSALNAG